MIKKIFTCIAGLSIISLESDAKLTNQAHNLQQIINQELIGLRKQHAPTETKVYFLLDQLDKLSALIKTIQEKKRAYKNKLAETQKTLTNELEEKNLIMKTLEKTAAHNALLTQKLEIEKTSNLILMKKNDDLLEEQQSKSDGHSLNLTSTSEPISPR